MITICNYDSYNSERPTDAQQKPNRRPTDAQQTPTNNNDNNVNNENKRDVDLQSTAKLKTICNKIMGNNSILPVNNSILPGNNPQSKVKYSKVKKSKVESADDKSSPSPNR